jgi:uncharacterized membrane protein
MAFIFVSIILTFFSVWIESDFIDNFTEDAIPLFTTVVTINIASSSLIAASLKGIFDSTGKEFTQTKNELIRSLKEQLVWLCVAFLVLLFKESKNIIDLPQSLYIQMALNSIIVTIFLLYVESIYDLGSALLTVMSFGDNGKS